MPWIDSGLNAQYQVHLYSRQNAKNGLPEYTADGVNVFPTMQALFDAVVDERSFDVLAIKCGAPSFPIEPALVKMDWSETWMTAEWSPNYPEAGWRNFALIEQDTRQRGAQSPSGMTRLQILEFWGDQIGNCRTVRFDPVTNTYHEKLTKPTTPQTPIALGPR